MQGENTDLCRPLAGVFNAADTVLWRKIRRNTNCKQPLARLAVRVYYLRPAALYLFVLTHYIFGAALD